jgi:hypothetical protein
MVINELWIRTDVEGRDHDLHFRYCPEICPQELRKITKNSPLRALVGVTLTILILKQVNKQTIKCLSSGGPNFMKKNAYLEDFLEICIL